MMFNRLIQVFIYVDDLEKAKKWYTETLELNVLFDDLKNNFIVLKLGETPLTLIKEDGKKIINKPYFNFFTEDIEKTHDMLQKKGVIVNDITIYDNMKSFSFFNIFKNKLEVCSF